MKMKNLLSSLNIYLEERNKHIFLKSFRFSVLLKTTSSDALFAETV